jgi:hypothetical protein
LGQHCDNAHWFEQITRVEMEQFATRKKAEIAERIAIKHEKPLYNIQFSERQAAVRAAAKIRRNETIKERPNPTTVIHGWAAQLIDRNFLRELIKLINRGRD